MLLRLVIDGEVGVVGWGEDVGMAAEAVRYLQRL